MRSSRLLYVSPSTSLSVRARNVMVVLECWQSTDVRKNNASSIYTRATGAIYFFLTHQHLRNLFFLGSIVQSLPSLR